jgi:hypothetical protein
VRLTSLALAVALVAGPGARRGEPAWFTLDQRQQQEALRVGERSVVAETFGDEWRVGGGAGESVLVVTPFHRLALASRHAAFKNEPLKPQEQSKVLQELKDKVLLVVQIRGPRQDFARYLKPRLTAGDHDIAPSLAQNEHTAGRQDDGRFLARCSYWFPTKDLAGTARVDLVVRDPDDRVVARFSIDLGRMR